MAEIENERKLTFDAFVEGFVAELVSRGVTSISPHSDVTTDALNRVCMTLQEEISKEADDVRRRALRDVFNQLRPDHLGTFDYFLAALRGKQLGFVSHPNPRYRELSFRISPTYAKYFLEQMQPQLREVLDRTALSFLKPEAAR